MKWWLLLLAACGTPTGHKVPGRSPMPQPTQHASPPACEDDVALSGDAAPDIRYVYAYDGHGRVAHMLGTFAAGGADETIDYGYDNLGHLMRTHDARGADVVLDVTAEYDTLGDLLVYDYAAPGDTRHYEMSAFTDAGLPTAELASFGGPAIHVQLDYDAFGRLARTTDDTGSTTTYRYDDDGRTLSIDTDGGKFHGEVVYDDRDRELSEAWGGSDPSAVPSETDYAYDGDRLLSVTMRQGSPLATVETDTLRYTCD
jgi:YD repeat-containing protein